MSSTLKFSGRDAELETIINRWHLVTQVEAPQPQIVLIRAERGLGKTRLALEFYKWLNRNVDGWLTKLYWPDVLEIVDKNLDVNPETQNCNFEVPIPYLWWGLRAGDRGSQNGVSGDAIATYDKFLAPHLVALLVRAQMKNRVWEFTKAWAEVGLDLTLSTLQVDNILSIGAALFGTVKILVGALSKEALNEAKDKPLSRAQNVLLDMEKIFRPGTTTYAKTPGVIFLDDAQFMHEDAALPVFIERLIHTAVMQRWPVLILVTSWRADLSPELRPNENSFALILKHIREETAIVDMSPAGLPGGYLSDDNFAEINLEPVADLTAALADKLPGLTREHSATILDKIAGNPRFLEQVVASLHEHEDFFEDLNTDASLTSEGFEEALKQLQSQDIFKFVYSRLHGFPTPVKEAICLASLQGVHFVNDLVEVLAEKRFGHSVLEPLAHAEDPYRILIGTNQTAEQPIGQFADRLFYDVCMNLRRTLPSLADEKALQATFRSTIASVSQDPDYSREGSIDARAMVYGIAANLFELSSDPNERYVAQRALGELAMVELSRSSSESAAAAYERLLAITPHSRSFDELKNRTQTWIVLSTIYRNLNWPSKEARAFRNVFREAVSSIPSGFDIFIRSSDRHAAVEHFALWKLEHPNFDDGIYLWVVRQMVYALLNLSEMARARPNLRIAHGDDPLEPTPFLVRSEPALEDSTETNSTLPDHLVQALFLEERAYALEGVLEEGEVALYHFKILEELAKAANADRDFQVAESFLLRALEISQARADELDQMATLSNLGMVAGEQGNALASANYLKQALDLAAAILTETFGVDMVVDEEGISSPRKVGHIAVPTKWSNEFDEDSDAVLRKVWKLKQLTANVHGNLAAGDQQNGRLAAAKEGFERSLNLHREIGDQEGVTKDLRSLGRLAQLEGDLISACSHWSECVKIFHELAQRDSDTLSAVIWKQAAENTLEEMRVAGCEANDAP